LRKKKKFEWGGLQFRDSIETGEKYGYGRREMKEKSGATE
jgi:hypothetical protein